LPPKRIIFIRHAEKPDSGNGDRGVAPDGSVDDESLTIRGWQRAGALTLFFSTRSEIKPSVIFASGIGHDSKSKRPIETVTALAGQIHPAPLITTHLRDDLHPLMEEVSTRNGTVLVCWEHKRIPALVGLLPGPPAIPKDWPDDRFDVLWIFDRTDDGWSFSQMPQLLLPGDSAKPIV
jgi:hypothetical protein